MRRVLNVLAASLACVFHVAGDVIESVTVDMDFLMSSFVKEFEKELNAPPGAAKPKESSSPAKVTRGTKRVMSSPGNAFGVIQKS